MGGAAKAFAPESIDTANIVKLTRVVWIFPLALGFGFLAARSRTQDPSAARRSTPFPWFVLWFLCASVVRTLVPAIAEFAPLIRTLSGSGFQLALFLIGTGLSRAVLREVGWRSVVQATVLWLLVSSGTLAVILWSR